MYKCNIEGKTEVTEDIENNAIYKKAQKDRKCISIFQRSHKEMMQLSGERNNALNCGSLRDRRRT